MHEKIKTEEEEQAMLKMIHQYF